MGRVGGSQKILRTVVELMMTGIITRQERDGRNCRAVPSPGASCTDRSHNESSCDTFLMACARHNIIREPIEAGGLRREIDLELDNAALSE